MNNLKVHAGIIIADSLSATSNNIFALRAPWSEPDKSKVLKILSESAEALRHIALMLLPFMPETAQKISRQLGVPYAGEMLRKDFVIGDKREWGSQEDWKQMGKPEILFAPVE